jgi:predicted anti-sigma-YlaC factor YlaD
MQHLTEEQLIAHYYHDENAADHLASCDECRARFETLRDVLALVDQLPIPERSVAYGQEVWTRLRWNLGSERRRSQVWGTIAAVAAALAIAFIGGVLWHARIQQLEHPRTTIAQTTAAQTAQHGPYQPAAIESASKDRLLLVVVSDHLDNSERMLLELSNADPKQPLDVSAESKRAVDLVASNRIYRQTAARRGETRIASLLSDLEPVLVELSHAGSTLSPDEIAALQKRIDSKGLLFKVRVVSAQVGGHEAPANAPRKGMDSL